MSPFPPELQARLALAIHAYAQSHGASTDRAQLAEAMDLACRYAHQRGMLPETMVIALRHSYHSLESTDTLPQARLRDAYERLLAGSLKAYFA